MHALLVDLREGRVGMMAARPINTPKTFVCDESEAPTVGTLAGA
jgi:hypothetical protein